MNLSGAIHTPIAGQVVVNLVDVLLDPDAGARGLRRAVAEEKTCTRALVDVAVALLRVSTTASELKENISDGLDKPNPLDVFPASRREKDRFRKRRKL